MPAVILGYLSSMEDILVESTLHFYDLKGWGVVNFTSNISSFKIFQSDQNSMNFCHPFEPCWNSFLRPWPPETPPGTRNTWRSIKRWSKASQTHDVHVFHLLPSTYLLKQTVPAKQVENNFWGWTLKWWYNPNKPMGFPVFLKMISTWGVKWGVSHHLRKHRNMNNHVPDLDCLMIDYCIYCSSVPFKLGFGEHDLIQIFWGRDLALTKSSILWYVAPFSSTKSWNYHLLVVFHQPLWKICASQNGWNSPPIFGVKISKIFELPPPRHDAT